MAEEKNLENKIKKWLKDNNIWYIKYWAGAKFTRSGIPDLICCVNGYFVAIEVKASTGRLTKIQDACLKRIKRSNGFAAVVEPSTWHLLKKQLERMNES